MPVLIVARNRKEYLDFVAEHHREVNPVDAVWINRAEQLIGVTPSAEVILVGRHAELAEWPEIAAELHCRGIESRRAS